jgi:hypothetical protein
MPLIFINIPMQKKSYYFLVLLVFLFFGCRTNPEVITLFVGPGVHQYHIPHSNWQAENSKKIYADLDITYRTNSENPVFINISFYNAAGNPRLLSSAVLEGGGIAYPLENLSTLYISVVKKELRVTSEGGRQDFLPLIRSEDIVLKAVVDGVEYRYVPGKDFYRLRDEFLAILIE